MSDYSYSEIQSMQQRAMERVREMNKSSQNALEMARAEFDMPKEPKSPVRETAEKPVTQSRPIKPKYTNMPPNFPKERQRFDLKETLEPEKKREPEKRREPERRADDGGFLEALLREPDRALLAGLILLLKSEGADEALMLALMYIMA